MVARANLLRLRETNAGPQKLEVQPGCPVLIQLVIAGFDPPLGSGRVALRERNRYHVGMTLSVTLPDEVIEALGPEPQREVLESVLLRLVQQNRMTVARAGELLGLDRLSAIRWYTEQGFTYPDLNDEDLTSEFEQAKL